MIHAAITAVALSCCTTITLAENTNHSEEGTPIEFAGGSVAEYIQEVADGFKTVDEDPNIVLLPGTEGVVLPPMSLRLVDPGDAFAAIADHTYTSADGRKIAVEFETIGGESTIFRISGYEQKETFRPRGRINGVDAVGSGVNVSIIRIPESRIATVISLSGKVLGLAGISGKTTLVPLPKDGLLLVSSTEEGEALVREVVFEVLRPTKDSGDVESKSLRGSPAKIDHRAEIRAELSRLAKMRNDDSIEVSNLKEIHRRFAEAMVELRRSN